MASAPPPRYLIALILLAFPVAMLPAARRWNATGHKTVTRVAWDNMSEHARAGAVALLRHGPPLADLASLAPDGGTLEEVDRGLFVESATWPDLVRTPGSAFHGYHHALWHFDDTFWKKSGGVIVAVDGLGPADTNAVERLTALKAVLLDPSAADTTRAVALAWVIHLVGDIHQPLHMSARVTAALPAGDRGGNSFKLKGTPNNLHSYWDGILDISTPKAAGEDVDEYIDRLASGVEQALPRSTVGDAMLHGSFEDWGGESLTLAQQKAYPTTLKSKQKPSPAYKAATNKIAEKRVALAGYRLAELLNGIFP